MRRGAGEGQPQGWAPGAADAFHPFSVVTARGVMLGVNSYIVKPVDFEQFTDCNVKSAI
jgi:hypothetical protein